MREYTPEQQALLDRAIDQIKDKVLFPERVAEVKRLLVNHRITEDRRKYDLWIAELIEYIDKNKSSKTETIDTDTEILKVLMLDYFVNGYSVQEAFDEEWQ